MADTNVASLQSQLNRFSSVAGFSPVSVSGSLDAATGSATLHALAYVNQADPTEADTSSGLISRLTNPDGSINMTQMASSASGLATYLGQEGDSLGLSPAGLIAGNAGGAAAVGADVLNAVKGLPTWAKVVGVAALGLGAIGIAMHVKKQHGSFAGLLGLG